MTTMTPLEPLYTLRVAAEMVPMVHVGALYDFLYKHPEFPIRTIPINRRETRVLLLSEVRRIRGMRVKERQRVKRKRKTLPE